MTLSIITINYNDTNGLKQTLESVIKQTYTNYELIVVDGGSIDESVEIIKSYENLFEELNVSMKWVSESDKGVYDAQNKGIDMATGDYCFFLNAGDCFCGESVLEKIFSGVCDGDLLYGNLRVTDQKGRLIGICKGVKNPTFLDFYNSFLKHQSTFIRRSLFEKFGKYDISLRIVADWEWFFRVAAFNNNISLHYVDIDVATFDNGGISNRSPEVCSTERQKVLDRYMSKCLQADYLLLRKYRNIRYIERSRMLELCQRVIGKIAKIIAKTK